LKKVLMIDESDVKVKPFRLDDFIQKENQSLQRKFSSKKVTKKELRSLADEMELKYEDSEITFTKKLITAYLKKIL